MISTEELAEGARIAWRNEARCIGRLFWEGLEVRDLRDLRSPQAIADACAEHLELAFHVGDVVSLISVFRPGVSILNHELVAYAGYSTCGDPMNRPLTDLAIKLGWVPPGGEFDLLPLLIRDEWGSVTLHDLPRRVVHEVEIRDARLPCLERLAVRWPATPVLSDMELRLQGESFTAAPFNGWYMETEIGARDLADPHRYGLLPFVAEDLGLDTTREATLWKDEAIVALCRAVLESYRRAGVTIVDHHTAVRQFAAFERKEHDAGREVTGTWSWLIPPVSPAATSVWWGRWPEQEGLPAYRYRAERYWISRPEGP